MPDLLIELLSEEIPARMQAKAADDMRRLMTEGLVEAGLTYESAGAFATPRRLTLAVEGLTAESRPVREERKGPAVGAPEAAVQGFLRSTGLTLADLERRPAGKGEAYFAVLTTPGRPAEAIVADVLARAIRDFPWPKSMRWGSGILRWVRPLQSILCLLTDETGARVVPFAIEGLTAADVTRGHRVLAPEPVRVTSFADYEAKLRAAHVLLRADDRAARIKADAETLAFAQGLEIVPDDGLLAEVAGLVEWPVVLMGRIEEAFLTLPPEVLRTSMKEHQKFFSARNPATGRIEGFVTVANIPATDGGAAILAGNARVLRARLSDARFFWDNDLRVARAGMGDWAEGLKAVTFHAKLGTQAERVERIAALAREIAPAVGADPDLAERAARLAKLDLRSQMVGEFPELQGRMGRLYAEAAGEDPQVAAAIEEHYSPLGPSDAVPTAPVSVAVALADKIDTLTGFWAIDEKPTGSKDPFALRRAALGVVRLVLGNVLRLETSKSISVAYRALLRTYRSINALFFRSYTGSFRVVMDTYFPSKEPSKDKPFWWVRYGSLSERTSDWADVMARYSIDEMFDESAHFYVEEEEPTIDSLSAFLHDRLKVHLRDQGITPDVIDAALAAPGADDLTLLVRRAEALAAFLKTDDGANLVQGYKRAANILSQAEAKDGVEYSYGADPKWAEGPEERALFAALDAAEPAIRAATAAEDFPAAMSALASLRAPLDAFFTAVQVNAENPVLRRNRLNLLSRIRALGQGVADLGRLAG